MTLIEAPPEQRDPSLTPPRTFASAERIRVRAFGLADAGELAGAFLSALALVWLVYERLTPLSGILGFWVCVYVAFLGIAWFVAREQRGAVVARDQVVRIVVWSGGVGLIVPLALIVIVVVGHGYHALRPHFFTQDGSRVGSLNKATDGGASDALVGTLEQVGLAMLISVPLGVTTAVFLNEIGGWLARPVRTIVDAMSAIPSIVAGLFIYIAVIRGLDYHPGGFAAALALSLLMLPTVTRTTELVLRLVPGGLREASLALGSTEWRTTRHVVLPTSRTGVVTAVILGVARVVGETAPLLLTLGAAHVFNGNPFSHPQNSLPLFIFNQFLLAQPSTVARAWTGAFVLLVLVLVLFLAARLAGGRGAGHIGRVRRWRLARKGLA
ncbi:MAG TPA: phosphate ABC transporter permease PstA [Acidimicrobiia bacterium]